LFPRDVIFVKIARYLLSCFMDQKVMNDLGRSPDVDNTMEEMRFTLVSAICDLFLFPRQAMFDNVNLSERLVRDPRVPTFHPKPADDDDLKNKFLELKSPPVYPPPFTGRRLVAMTDFTRVVFRVYHAVELKRKVEEGDLSHVYRVKAVCLICDDDGENVFDSGAELKSHVEGDGVHLRAMSELAAEVEMSSCEKLVDFFRAHFPE
jgi:hypothetical protein